MTWIKICCSRRLIVQVNGGRLEFWNLDNRSDSPRAVFDGDCDAINWIKLLPESVGKYSLVVPTRYGRSPRLSGTPNVPWKVLTSAFLKPRYTRARSTERQASSCFNANMGRLFLPAGRVWYHLGLWKGTHGASRDSSRKCVRAIR